MKKLTSIEGILDFAIGAETKAHELYLKMAAMAKNPWVSKTIEGMAQEELQHKRKLKAVRAGRIALEREDVGDLGIADTLDDVEPHAEMDYRELVRFAVKKEAASQKLYSRLASVFSEPELRETFLRLAAEEADHKRRFEMQHDWLTS